MPSSPSVSLSSIHGSRSVSFTLRRHLTILLGALVSANSSSRFTGQVSLPCKLQLLTLSVHSDDGISYFSRTVGEISL